jgi:hypothetical protein
MSANGQQGASVEQLYRELTDADPISTDSSGNPKRSSTR